MYYFELNGHEVRCESAEELHKALGSNGKPVSTANGATATATKPATATETTRDTKESAAQGKTSELPLLNEKVSWPIAKKIAKQLGRENELKAVRDELVAKRRAAGMA